MWLPPYKWTRRLCLLLANFKKNAQQLFVFSDIIKLKPLISYQKNIQIRYKYYVSTALHRDIVKTSLSPFQIILHTTKATLSRRTTMSNSSANLTPNFPCCYKGSNISSPSRAQLGSAQITVGAPPSPISVWEGEEKKNAAGLK